MLYVRLLAQHRTLRQGSQRFRNQDVSAILYSLFMRPTSDNQRVNLPIGGSFFVRIARAESRVRLSQLTLAIVLSWLRGSQII
jgi:hypothetical protein